MNIRDGLVALVSQCIKSVLLTHIIEGKFEIDTNAQSKDTKAYIPHFCAFADFYCYFFKEFSCFDLLFQIFVHFGTFIAISVRGNIHIFFTSFTFFLVCATRLFDWGLTEM